MGDTNHVPTAGGNSRNTSRITEVSIICPIVVTLIKPFSLGNREINTLHVKCSHANRGCEWVGTVGTIEKHVATCGFILVPCPKQCKDDNNEVKCFTRKEVDDHLQNDCPKREYECQSKCGEMSTYAYITEVHDKTCKMKILPCSNDGCDTEIQRQQIGEHVSKCPHTVISCKYKGIGCDTELKRKDMTAHEQDDKLHLHMALEAVISLRSAVETLQIEVYSQHDRLMMMNYSGAFRLSEYQKKKEANKPFRFSSFYTHPNGYHMALRVYANGEGDSGGTHVSVHAPILTGKYDAKLKWPFVGKVTFTLLNQLEDKNHHTRVMTLNTAKNTIAGENPWGYQKFIPHSALAHDLVKNTQYLKNDTLYFRMEVETEHKP